jgi:glutamyl-tRNA synthetase
MKGKTPQELADIFQMLVWNLERQVDFSAQSLEALFRGMVEKLEIKLRDLTGPCFVALSGRAVWTPLFDSMEILGSDLVRMRLRRAIEALGGISGKRLKGLEKEYRDLFGASS